MSLLSIQIEALEAEHEYYVRWSRFSSRQKIHHSQEAYDERDRLDTRERDRDATRERDQQSELLEEYYQDMQEQRLESRYPDRYGWDQYSYNPDFN